MFHGSVKSDRKYPFTQNMQAFKSVRDTALALHLWYLEENAKTDTIQNVQILNKQAYIFSVTVTSPQHYYILNICKFYHGS